MDLLAILFLAVGLAMDAFAVSICKGLAMKTPKMKAMVIIGIWFGFFQAIMPIIGYYLGTSLYQYISQFDHWIAFILLLAIGLNMIRESLSDEDEDKIDDNISFKIMLVLAIATSIDALAVGISIAMDGADILIPAAIIGIVTMVISMAGVKIGSIFGNKYCNKAEFVGGLILILIGFRILLSHLGVI